MRQKTPYIVLFFAVIFALFALFGNDSYSELTQLRERLAAQTEYSSGLQKNVNELRRSISGLKRDDRHLETVARDELGLVRDDEIIFIFDDE